MPSDAVEKFLLAMSARMLKAIDALDLLQANGGDATDIELVKDTLIDLDNALEDALHGEDPTDWPVL